MNKSVLRERISKRTVVTETGCWEWIGAKDRYGYGRMGFQVEGELRYFRVHRISHEVFRSEIPQGLVIDHLCRNRACANPAHMEAISAKENIRRGLRANLAKAECPKGHPYSIVNTYTSKAGKRSCRACQRERMKKKRVDVLTRTE